MYNGAIGKKIGDAYTKPQQELVERILKSICSDDEGYAQHQPRRHLGRQRLVRRHCGANIFGEPVDGKKFAWSSPATT